MWLDVAIDVLMPTGRSRSERPKPDEKSIPVEVQVPGAFTRSLNASGELDDEAIAVGTLTQGKPRSVLALLSGLALIDLLRPRRSKTLPREFALAVTADRVVTFAMSARAEGTEYTTTLVKIKRGARGAWPRELVRVIDQHGNRLAKGGTLEVAGERILVVWDDHDSTKELLSALSGQTALAPADAGGRSSRGRSLA
jgi:hypothetical protein